MKKNNPVSPSLTPSPANPTPFRRRRFSFSWKKTVIFLLFVAGLSILTLIGIFAYFIRFLPNPEKIASRPIAQSTLILDRNGTTLYSFHGEENRILISANGIPDTVKDATIATEDANFYTEPGFSVKGIARAIYDHFAHRTIEGGSTITQQYVKNTLLSDTQTLNRKLKELVLSIEVEHIYSKQQILTGYLNQIPYGSNAYGIEAAAETYFNEPASKLTLSQAATLAALPQAPTYYSPYGNHLDDLFARKNYILDRMVATGYISKAQAAQAKNESPTLAHPDFRQQTNLLAPHFVFYVREKLIEQLGGDPQQAEERLDEGGYKVTTSLDLSTQELAQKTLAELGPDAIKKYHASNAALVAMDPKTGEILAMVGSIDYNNSISGQTNFTTSLLQPGSSFKPIVYATAFSPAFTYSPATINQDVPTDFGGGYRPNDFDLKFRGPVTNRQALAESLNIPAVKNLSLVGVSQALNTAKALGITTLNQPASSYGLSLALGSGEVMPVELLGAYATFANNGLHNPIRPILKIEQNNKVINDFTQTPAQKAVEPEVAYEITSILSDNAARTPIFGAHSPLILDNRPVAAKTGTTENFKDGWTIGYTPSIAVAVWAGNNQPGQTMIPGTDGVVVAGPIWHQFMQSYLQGKPVEQFSRPASIQDILINKYTGKIAFPGNSGSNYYKDIFAPWQIPKQHEAAPPTPSPTPTPSPSPTPQEPTPSAEPSASPVATPLPTPTPIPSALPTATPTPTPFIPPPFH